MAYGSRTEWGKTVQCPVAVEIATYNVYIMLRRTQIYLDDRQRRKLDQVAKRTRRTVSELIREAIEARYAATPKEDFSMPCGLVSLVCGRSAVIRVRPLPM